MVRDLEERGQEIHYHDAEDISDHYARTHQRELRQRVLSMDKAAIKKVMQSKAIHHGQKDLEELIEEAREKGDFRNKYTINYPDGSWAQVEMTDEADPNSQDDTVKTQTLIPGPWNDWSYIGSNRATSSGNRVATTTWRYSSGSSYASVRDQHGYNWNGGTRVTHRYSDGAATSIGVVEVQTVDKSNNRGSSATGSNRMSSWTDARFKVSASFSASYLGLSIGASAGSSWHQYAVTEVSGNGYTYHFAAQYK
mgnify:FL=1